MGRVEPSADMRQAAHSMREMYLALIEQGFSETQACSIIGTMLGQNLGRGSDDGT
jgi:hypothetical protein